MKASLLPKQLAIWKRQRGEHRIGTFNIPVMARLFGNIDKDTLAAVVYDVIDRHKILRTIFPESDGFPGQVILEEAVAPALSLQQVDTLNMTQAIKMAVDYPFDLSRETPIRAHLFSTGEHEHTLLFVFHRIAFDSHSVDPLIRDLFAFYSARMENREPNLPPMLDSITNYELRITDVQHADYTLIPGIDSETTAVNDYTTSGDAENFWSEGIVPVRINPGVHSRLAAFVKEAGVSLDSIFHAGLTILFSRLDIYRRAAISTIRRVDYQPANPDPPLAGSECNQEYRIPAMIGNFEEVLPFKIDIQDNPTFREAVNRASKAASAGFADESRHFRVLFRLKPVGVETLDLPRLKVFVKHVTVKERGYDLIFDLSERLSNDGKPRGIEGNVIFNSNFLAPRLIPTQLEWLMNLLKYGVMNPDTRINELPVEEKPTEWTYTALVPECTATDPQYDTITRIATVHDDGRQERVYLNDTQHSSSIAAVAGWQQNYVAFQDVLQCRLAGIWEETLGVSRVGVRDRFADLGGDINHASRVVASINKVFGKNFPVSLMCGGATVESLANVIFREQPFETVSVIQPVLPDSKPPLFFIHGAVFGGGLYTIEMSQCLGADMPFYSINPHGMNGLEIPETIEKMAEDNLRILRQMCPEGPFRLGGYCNGALIAYEMARMLEHEGRRLDTPLLMVEAPHGDISEGLSQHAAQQKSRMTKPSTAMQSLQMRKTWALNELFRLSGSYRPGKYAGPVIIIQPEKSLSEETIVRAVWKKAVDNIQFLNTPGDHITCIGRHAPELAGILRGIMDNPL